MTEWQKCDEPFCGKMFQADGRNTKCPEHRTYVKQPKPKEKRPMAYSEKTCACGKTFIPNGARQEKCNDCRGVTAKKKSPKLKTTKMKKLVAKAESLRYNPNKEKGESESYKSLTKTVKVLDMLIAAGIVTQDQVEAARDFITKIERT